MEHHQTARIILQSIFLVANLPSEPQNYMFRQMREAVGIPAKNDILDFIYALPQDEQEDAMTKIRAIESEAMKLQKPQPGLVELMDYLQTREIRKGICTRNFEYVLFYHGRWYMCL
jgi:hypothetical protein